MEPTLVDHSFIARTLGQGILRAAKEGRVRDVLIMLLRDHMDLVRTPQGQRFAMALAIRIQAAADITTQGRSFQPVGTLARSSCSEYVVPGKIGSANLMNGCYSFWECVTLMGEDIARTVRVDAVRTALAGGQTVRQLMASLYGVAVPEPTVSDYTSDRFEAKVLKKRIRHFEAVAVGQSGL